MNGESTSATRRRRDAGSRDEESRHVGTAVKGTGAAGAAPARPAVDEQEADADGEASARSRHKDASAPPDRRAGPAFRWTRRNIIGFTIIVALFVAFLGGSRIVAVVGKSDLLTAFSAGGPLSFSERFVTAGEPPLTVWFYTGLNYWESVVLGMTFAMMISGSLEAFLLPQRAIDRFLSRRGVSGAVVGSVLGLPLNMCAACSVPPAIGYFRKGASLETMLAVIHGSALLNIIGLATILLLFPWQIGVVRVVAGLAGALVLVPLVALAARRLGDRCEINREVPGVGDTPAPPAPPSNEPWKAAISGAVREWWARSAKATYRLFPLMLAAGFVAAAIRFAFPQSSSAALLGGGPGAILLMAGVGTLLAIPTLFEIPLVLSLFLVLFSQGLGYGPASALLVAAPAASVVTFGMLYRDTGWRVPGLMMAGAFALSAAAGFATEALVALSG